MTAYKIFLLAILVNLFPVMQTKAEDCGCNDHCMVYGIPVLPTDALAPFETTGGTRYISWSSLTIKVNKDNSPPTWFNASKLSTMLTDARAAWSDNTCLTIGTGYNITFYFISSQSSWDEFGDESIIAAPNYITVDPNSGYITDVQIFVNCAYFTDDDWNDDGETTTALLTDSPIDGTALFIHEIGHGLGLWCPEIGGPQEPDAEPYTLCTAIVRGYNVFGGPKPLDVSAVSCAYGCENRLVINSQMGVAAYATCPYRSLADVFGFRITNAGIAEWLTLSERGTIEYQIIGIDNRLGTSSEVLAVDSPGFGKHAVSLSNNIFGSYALVEINQELREKIIATYKMQSNDNQKWFRQSMEPLLVRSIMGKTQHNQRIDPPECPTYVIFSGHDYVSDVNWYVARWWRNQGYEVTIIDVSTYPLATRAQDIKNAIESYADTCGTMYFHLIGDNADAMSSQLWETDSYWRDMKETLLRLHLIRPEPVAEQNAIPTFLHPDLRRFSGGALSLQPFSMTDQDYADLNGDGKPDVVVTRWPVNSYMDVIALASKMKTHTSTPRWHSRTVVSSAHDEDSGAGGLGSGAQVAEMASLVENLVLGVDGGVTAYPFRTSWFDGNTADVNDSLATALNDARPELLTMLATRSDNYWPCGVMHSHSWDMSMLETYTVIPLVNAASCVAGLASVPYYAPFEFLFTAQKGSIAWTGPTGASWSDANFVYTSFLVEELYTYPERSMAESWLRAVQRAYDVFANYPDQLGTIRSYIFNGDPLSPFRVQPDIEIGSYVREPDSTSLSEMPANTAVGCPGGDADEIVITVSVDSTGLGGVINPSDLYLGTPGEEIIFYETLEADSAADMVDGRLETTITISEYGGCGIDSAAVYLHDVLVGYAKLNVKSPDMRFGELSSGIVDLLDLVEFGFHYPSSVCDCIYQYDFSECSNFVGSAPDTLIDILDFGFFAGHYNHETSSGSSGVSARELAYSAGNVELVFTEDYPLTGKRTLKAAVGLKDVEKYSAMFVSFKNENPTFTFSKWKENPAYPGHTMCTEIVRNGQKEIILGIIGNKDIASSVIDLGYFELDVYSDSPLELTSDDFALVTADLLELNGNVLTFKGTQVQQTVRPTVYRNALAQNYPNPFNPSTTIAYSLANDSNVELRVYDVRGALVKTLVDGHRRKNNYKVFWDGKNNSGNSVASGVYFYRLIAGDFKATKKMVLLR